MTHTNKQQGAVCISRLPRLTSTGRLEGGGGREGGGKAVDVSGGHFFLGKSKLMHFRKFNVNCRTDLKTWRLRTSDSGFEL